MSKASAPSGPPTAAKAGPITEQLGCPPGKRVKTDMTRVNDARTILNRTVSGSMKNATPAQVEHAHIGLDILNTCSKDEKLAFAVKMEQTKGNKSFAWVRDFRESMKSTTVTNESVLEIYKTRTVM